jgi:hypothetical protein
MLLPYAMLWQYGPFIVACAVLQFPVYGWIIGHAWVRNRIVVGFTLVICPHVIALLLSVATAVAKYS